MFVDDRLRCQRNAGCKHLHDGDESRHCARVAILGCDSLRANLRAGASTSARLTSPKRSVLLDDVALALNE
jgi:hypothetical protein